MNVKMNKWLIEIGAMGESKTHEKTYSEVVSKNAVESYESENRQQMVKSKVRDELKKEQYNHTEYLAALQYESYIKATLIESESESDKNENE